jgi:hypothetical protein
VQLPVSVLDEATSLRKRMQKCAEYNLEDEPEEAKLLAVLRVGQGYQDLAGDLLGLADIYKRRKAALAADKKLYRASDAAAAVKLGNRILDLLGTSSASTGDGWTEMQSRAWTLLLQVYEEVCRGGRFLFARDSPETMFPSLIAAARARASARAGGSEEAVGDAEAPEKGSEEPA